MTPDLDLNDDGVCDMVVGAAGSGSGLGKLYVVYGTLVTYPQDLARGQAAIQAETAANENPVITNDSILGTSYLDTRGPVPKISGSLPAPTPSNPNPESWYTFTTLGDGSPSNQIVVSPVAQPTQTTTLTPQSGVLQGPLQTQQVFATGSEPNSVAVGDFNGDGKLDLAVVNYGSNTVSVFLGNGNGTYQAPQTYATGNGPRSVAVGDFNGDGKADLVVTNYGQGLPVRNPGDTVSVLLGNGNGTFQPQQTFATGSYPISVAVGDFNGDGKLDLAVVNSGSNTLSVLLNTTTVGATTVSFAPQQTFAAGSVPVSVAVGDFNGDGKADLAVGSANSRAVSVFLGNGNGTFQPRQTFATGIDPYAIAVADFNGDGKVDLAVANYGFNTVSVFLGNGDGTFLPQQTFATGSDPYAIAVADFNGDGKSDLAVANEGSNTVSVLLGNGDGTFQPQQTFATGSEPTSLAVGDFNGDGKTDLAIANSGSNTVSILLQGYQIVATDVQFQTQQTFATGASPESVVVGDFNGDGNADLAVTNYGSNTLSILLGNGNGTFMPEQTFATGSGPGSIAVGDFNGDGIEDLAVANRNSNTVSVFLGNGNGTFQPQQTFATGSYPWSIAVGDFNGDGKEDLAVANYNSETLSILLGNGNGTFQTQQTVYTGDDPISVVVGDFNGDGEADLAVANYASNDLSVLLNLTPIGATSLNFQTQTFATGSYPISVAVGDFNDDGKVDLAVANYQSSNVSVLLNTTTTGGTIASFQTQQTIATGYFPTSVVVGDFNGDGKADLAVVDSNSNTLSLSNNLSLLLGNGNGSFQTQQTAGLVKRAHGVSRRRF